MKILFLLRSSIFNRIGGSELQAYYLSRELTKYGHKIHYAFDSNDNLEIEDEIISYHFLHDYGTLFPWLNFFSLKKLLKQINPDIIYQRCRFAYTGFAANYAKKKSIKMVYNVSSDWDCEKNKIQISKAFIPNMIDEYLGRYGIKNTDQIIAQTCYQQKLLKQNFSRDSIVIPNAHAIPNNNFKKEHPPLVVWISNIKQLKQPELFIDLAQRCENSNCKFIFAGKPANNVYQNKLMLKMKKCLNIKYLGKISFDRANILLSKASIFVNTSLFEGFPNTFIQAWLRETPVASLNVDPDDILKRYKIGFHSKTFEQLVKDVRYLIENEGERKDMGKRAREYAVEHHDIEKIKKKYLEVFEELIEK